MLSCYNITATIEEHILFQDLAFSIYPGSLVLIKGHNGIGKSSLLRIIAGLMKPEIGEVIWLDEWGMSHKLSEININYLGHQLALKPQETMWDHLHFWASFGGNYFSLDAAIMQFELEDYLDEYVGNLSSGWRKRLALARMMLRPAPLWLLDEPDVNLDQKGRDRLQNMIKAALVSHNIVMMVSHQEYDMEHITINLEDYKTRGK